MIDLRHEDCMEYMAGLPDKAFDLAIVDPPYGIDIASKTNTGQSGGSDGRWKTAKSEFYASKDWDKSAPDAEYFLELQRISTNQIIWGGNYFSLPPTNAWIVWDKEASGNYSDGEMAWTSLQKPLQIFRWLWNGFRQASPEKRIHPTQKPVALYEWLLTNYAKPGQRILDTHLGSGSSAIAAHNLGFDFVGTELDADYYAAAVRRFEAHKAQAMLFQPDDYDRVTRDYQESMF